MDTKSFFLARLEIQDRLERSREQTAEGMAVSNDASHHFSLWPVAKWALGQASEKATSKGILNRVVSLGLGWAASRFLLRPLTRYHHNLSTK